MFTYPDIDPVLLDLGVVKVRWYGMMYLLGFLAGWLLARRRASRSHLPGAPYPGWTSNQVDDLITYCVVGLIFGARVGYVLFYNLDHFLAYPLSIVMINEGGMSFHGGLLGLVAAAWWFMRRHGKSVGEVADFVAPLAPPGLFFGRIGNFINAELWGKVTDSPLGMVFPTPDAGPLPRHPSQLYEAALEGLVLFVVLWLFSSRPRPRLAVIGLFLLLYGVFRFAVEFVREPDPQLGYLAFDWLTMGQVLCVPMILVGGAFLFRAYRRKPLPA
jgi:phosphatidylglycerol---prolipoprotein diacylglyceryl transferase